MPVRRRLCAHASDASSVSASTKASTTAAIKENRQAWVDMDSDREGDVELSAAAVDIKSLVEDGRILSIVAPMADLSAWASFSAASLSTAAARSVQAEAPAVLGQRRPGPAQVETGRSMADQVQQESTEPPSAAMEAISALSAAVSSVVDSGRTGNDAVDNSDEGDEGDAKMDPALWAFTGGLASTFSGEVDSTSLMRHYAAFVSSRVASGSDKACALAEAMSIVKEFAEFEKTS